MHVGIRKPGQGYWVRTLSAILAGVLVLAAAAWAWQETGVVDMPIAGYDVVIDRIEGDTPQPGQTVELAATDPEGGDALVVIGSADIAGYTPASTGGEIQLRNIRVASGEIGDTSTARELRGQSFTAVPARSAYRAVESFPLIYVRAIVAGTLVIIGAVAIYWFAGSGRQPVDFLVNTDGEMRKVNWSTRREVIGSTQVVIAASFLIAAALFTVDLFFRFVFGSIDVLQT